MTIEQYRPHHLQPAQTSHPTVPSGPSQVVYIDARPITRPQPHHCDPGGHPPTPGSVIGWCLIGPVSGAAVLLLVLAPELVPVLVVGALCVGMAVSAVQLAGHVDKITCPDPARHLPPAGLGRHRLWAETGGSDGPWLSGQPNPPSLPHRTALQSDRPALPAGLRGPQQATDQELWR